LNGDSLLFLGPSKRTLGIISALKSVMDYDEFCSGQAEFTMMRNNEEFGYEFHSPIPIYPCEQFSDQILKATWGMLRKPIYAKEKFDASFADVTVKAGLQRVRRASSVCVGDYNNDALEDLFCAYWGHNALHRDSGDGMGTKSQRIDREDRRRIGRLFVAGADSNGRDTNRIEWRGHVQEEVGNISRENVAHFALSGSS
jgi:hypothetical protein